MVNTRPDLRKGHLSLAEVRQYCQPFLAAYWGGQMWNYLNRWVASGRQGVLVSPPTNTELEKKAADLLAAWHRMTPLIVTYRTGRLTSTVPNLQTPRWRPKHVDPTGQ